MDATARRQEPLTSFDNNEPGSAVEGTPVEAASPEVDQEPEVSPPFPEAGESATQGAEDTAALECLETAVSRGFAEVLQAFRDKIAYDEAKERQITRLHGELQEHRRDLVAKTKRPLIQGLVRLHDDLGKVVAALHRRPQEELTPERFFRAFEGFEDDLELLLAQHGVERFTMPGEAFDPCRQTALRTEIPDEPDLAGIVAARLRPGFAEGETVLQKERVAVYAAPRGSSRPPAEAKPAAGPAPEDAIS